MNNSYAFNKPFVRFLILFSLVIPIFVTSCTLQTTKIDETVEVSETDLLIEKLRSYNRSVSYLEGKALVVYKEDDKTYSFRVNIAVDKNSDRFRLDASDFVFKKLLLTLIRNENDVLAVNYSKKTIANLLYDDFDFSSLIGLRISKEIFEHAFLGEVFIIEGPIQRGDSEYPSLYIKAGEETETVLFNEELLPAQALYLFVQDSLAVDYSKYEYFEDVRFPRKITVKTGDRRLIINYSELVINIPIKREIFCLENKVLEGFTRLD